MPPRLPAELLAEIVGLVDDTATLLSLILVSRQCFALAHRHLFHTLLLTPTHFGQLVSTLERNPNYCNFVQSVQWLDSDEGKKYDDPLEDWKRLIPLLPRLHTIRVYDGAFDTLGTYLQPESTTEFLSLVHLQHLVLPTYEGIGNLIYAFQDQLVSLQVWDPNDARAFVFYLQAPLEVDNFCFPRLETLRCPREYLIEGWRTPNKTLRHVIWDCGNHTLEADSMDTLLDHAKEEKLELLYLNIPHDAPEPIEDWDPDDETGLDVLEAAIDLFQNLRYFGWAPILKEAGPVGDGVRSIENHRCLCALQNLKFLQVLGISIEGNPSDDTDELPLAVHAFMQGLYLATSASHEDKDSPFQHLCTISIRYEDYLNETFRFGRRQALVPIEKIVGHDVGHAYERRWEQLEAVHLNPIDEFVN